MPLRPEYRWNTFLVVAGLLLMIFPTVLLMKHVANAPYNTFEVLVFGQAGMLITLIVGFIGQNLATRKTRHELKGRSFVLESLAQDAKLEAAEAKEKAAEAKEKAAGVSKTIEEIKDMTNGNLEKAVQKVAHEVRVTGGMVPFHEVKRLLLEARDEACGKIADEAARKGATMALELYLKHNPPTPGKGN